jgi:Methyltransferase domain
VTGRRVVGVDISEEMLRLARPRARALVRADAIRLPSADRALGTVTSTYLHTDIDEIAPVFAEVERVLRPGGLFVYPEIHPCFVGPFIEIKDETTQVVHAGCRDARWHDDSPYFRKEGLGRRVGFRHLPLADLVRALIASGLRLTEIEEPPEEHPLVADMPRTLALVAVKEPEATSGMAQGPSDSARRMRLRFVRRLEPQLQAGVGGEHAQDRPGGGELGRVLKNVNRRKAPDPPRLKTIGPHVGFTFAQLGRRRESGVPVERRAKQPKLPTPQLGSGTRPLTASVAPAPHRRPAEASASERHRGRRGHRCRTQMSARRAATSGVQAFRDRRANSFIAWCGSTLPTATSSSINVLA